jgi:hypothetical protein
VFCSKGEYCFLYKNKQIYTIWYKEVNRTKLSLSARVPCCLPYHLFQSLWFLKSHLRRRCLTRKRRQKRKQRCKLKGTKMPLKEHANACGNTSQNTLLECSMEMPAKIQAKPKVKMPTKCLRKCPHNAY